MNETEKNIEASNDSLTKTNENVSLAKQEKEVLNPFNRYTESYLIAHREESKDIANENLFKFTDIYLSMDYLRFSSNFKIFLCFLIHCL